MIYDCSLPLRPRMPVYRGNPPFRRIVTHELRKGHVVNESRLELGAHCGTHVDAPRHFEKDGRTAGDIPLGNLLGPARLLHFPGVDAVDAKDLERFPWKGVRRVLLRTRNSEHWKRGGGFDPRYAYLTPGGARFLASKKIRLVGIDGLGIERFGGPDYGTHHTLLRRGITVLEGLSLAGIPAGDYTLFCGPLRIEGGDGAPARVFLVKGPLK